MSAEIIDYSGALTPDIVRIAKIVVACPKRFSHDQVAASFNVICVNAITRFDVQVPVETLRHVREAKKCFEAYQKAFDYRAKDLLILSTDSLMPGICELYAAILGGDTEQAKADAETLAKLARRLPKRNIAPYREMARQARALQALQEVVAAAEFVDADTEECDDVYA